MNSGKYLFSQLVEFLPKRVLDGIVKKYSGDKYVKTFTCWNQLLVMMYGQHSSCDSLREVICIIDAIKNKSYHLGFGRGNIKLSNVAYANANRDYRIFEEFAYYMINLAQSKRLDREFVLHGKFYTFDSTTIDLCLSLFQWAFFRKTKGGIKIHRLFIVEHDCELKRTTFNVLRVVSRVLTDKTPIRDLFNGPKNCRMYVINLFNWSLLLNINRSKIFFGH